MDKYLSTYNVLFLDNKLIMSDMDSWLMAEWDLDTEKYNTISRLMPLGRYNEIYRVGLIMTSLLVGDFIYCILRNTAQLIKIDRFTGHFTRLGLNYNIGKIGELLYCSAEAVEGRIYMLPYNINQHIMVYDTETGTYDQGLAFSDIIDIPIEFNSENKIYSYICDNGRVWFAVSGTDMVIYADYIAGEVIKLIHCGGKLLSKITGDVEKVFACGTDRKSVFGINDDGTASLVLDSENGRINSCSFALKKNNNIFYVNSDGSIYVQDTSAAEMRKIELPDTFKNIDSIRGVKDIPFSNMVYKDGKLYLLPFSSNGLVTVDVNTFATKHYALAISDEEVKRERLKQEDILSEDDKLRLEDFIDSIR